MAEAFKSSLKPVLSPVLTECFDVLACPRCRGSLRVIPDGVDCESCHAIYAVEDGIPLLFHPHAASDTDADVTEIVKTFYETNPFPNYDDLDSRESLAQKASRGLFAKLLDQQIPAGALVLEGGCGTGQLSNFLGMSWNRRVIGSDLCFNSLRLAKGFRDRFAVNNAGFLQMNLFRPAFREQVFDVVVSNGVLHHTSDPLGGFQSLASLVKENGVIIIGLYNHIGRLPTDFRRGVFNVFGDRLRTLDDHMRQKTYNEARKRAWFMDQYKHPHESKHSYSEVMEWFEDNGFDFLFSIPKLGSGAFSPNEHLFEKHDKGSRWSRFRTELEMLMQGGKDGAIFIMIGRKLRH